MAPFVTRPTEVVLDREALGLAPATDAVTGLYALRKANGKGEGTIVLSGKRRHLCFPEEATRVLKDKGVDLNLYYVASAELFESAAQVRAGAHLSR